MEGALSWREHHRCYPLVASRFMLRRMHALFQEPYNQPSLGEWFMFSRVHAAGQDLFRQVLDCLLEDTRIQWNTFQFLSGSCFALWSHFLEAGRPHVSLSQTAFSIVHFNFQSSFGPLVLISLANQKANSNATTKKFWLFADFTDL